MNNTRLVLVITAAGCAASQASLLAIDFQPTNGTTTAGYQAFEFTTQGAFPVSSDYNEFGTTVTISVDSAMVGDTNDNRSIQRNGALTDVANDWLGVDARNAAGGNPEAQFIIMISGLPAGDYTWTSLLHDGGVGASGPGQGNINGNVRTTFVDANGTVNGTNTISAENPGGGAPPQPRSTFETAFVSDGSPVSLTIGSTGANGDAIFALAATVEIESVPIPEPSSAMLVMLAGGGLLRRRR